MKGFLSAVLLVACVVWAAPTAHADMQDEYQVQAISANVDSADRSTGEAVFPPGVIAQRSTVIDSILFGGNYVVTNANTDRSLTDLHGGYHVTRHVAYDGTRTATVNSDSCLRGQHGLLLANWTTTWTTTVEAHLLNYKVSGPLGGTHSP